MKWNIVEHIFQYLLRKLGNVVAVYPWPFILLPLTSAIALIAIFQNEIRVDINLDMFIPENAMHRKAKASMENLFSTNFSSGYDNGRALDLEYFARISMIYNQNGSILTEKSYDKILNLNNIIKNISIQDGNSTLKYKDLCADINSKGCHIDGVLKLEPYKRFLGSRKYKFKYPLHITPKFDFIFLGDNVGAEKLDSESYVISAGGLSLNYFLNPTRPDLFKKWNDAFLKVMPTIKIDDMTIVWHTSDSLIDEIVASTFIALPLVAPVFAVMLIFGTVVFTRMDMVRNQFGLAFIGFINVVIAIIGSMYFCVFVGIPFVNINFGIVFTMVIGLVDVYSLLISWSSTNKRLSARFRLAETYSQAGTTSLMGTLLTTSVFGCASLMPFKITVFGGILVLSENFRKSSEKKMICNLGTAELLQNSNLNNLQCAKSGARTNQEQETKNSSNKCFSSFDAFNRLIPKFARQLFVFSAFWVLLGAGIHGCMQFEESVDATTLLDSRSYEYDFHKIQQKYFTQYLFRFQIVINESLNYSDPIVQEQVATIISKLENIEQVSPLLTENWLQIYLVYLRVMKYVLSLQGTDVEKELGFLRGLGESFFKKPPTKVFMSDIHFNEDRTQIISTRYLMQVHQLVNNSDYFNFFKRTSEIAKNAPFNMFIYNPFFGFLEQILVIKKALLQFSGLSLIVYFFLSLIIIPKPINVILSTFINASTFCSLIGLVSIWGVKLELVTLICLFFLFAFIICNTLYMLRAFEQAKCQDPNERMQNAMKYVLFSAGVSSGALFVGSPVLVFSYTQIVVDVFKLLFLASGLSLFNSLLVLPMCLQIKCHLNNIMMNSRSNEGVEKNHVVKKSLITD